MGLVVKHEGEHRRWYPAWGTSSGESDWQKFLQPVVAGQPADAPAVGGSLDAVLLLDTEDPIVTHHQLQLSPMTSSPGSDLQSARQMAMSGSDSTIVRRSAGQPLAAAYEARNVFITNLPEVLLLHMDKCMAKQLPPTAGMA